MKRSKFSLSNYKLLSCDMGELVPCGLTEVLPGDTIQQATSALVRVSPLLSPVMHPVHVKIHHFFVPHRLVWDDWENFVTGGPDGLNASVFPTIAFADGGPEIGTLADYLGVPTDIPNADSVPVSALPFRGYALIWNEFYRDQDLQAPLVIDRTDGVDTTTNRDLQNIAWEKDYFTSARPWTQKGAEVTLPLSGNAKVKGIGVISGSASTNQVGLIQSDGTNPNFYGCVVGTNYSIQNTTNTNASFGLANPPNMYADLSGVSAANINELRTAFALQRYQEARARYGSRYTEYLAYLGVKSSDARLSRPEYLGGGKQTLQFSEVLATAETGTSVDVGDLKGHGIAALRSNRYRKFFEEHGYIYSFISVKPKTIYAQGIPRTFNRRVKEDFFQKELQHIGQQEVLNKELYAAHTTPDGIFGYQDRYDEYRRTESTIAGEFRSTLLNYWHMARIFASEPALNADFIKSVPTKRINAVQTNDVLWVMVNHSIQARRLVSGSANSFIL